MIQDGDYIRQRSTGYLLKVHFIDQELLCTIRIHDSAHVRVPITDAVRITSPSLLPGDPETVERAA